MLEEIRGFYRYVTEDMARILNEMSSRGPGNRPKTIIVDFACERRSVQVLGTREEVGTGKADKCPLGLERGEWRGEWRDEVR